MQYELAGLFTESRKLFLREQAESMDLRNLGERSGTPVIIERARHVIVSLINEPIQLQVTLVRSAARRVGDADCLAYAQAEFAAVPNNFNDVLLWSKEFGPVILSCKTSLRERYKQADLEAVALRQHFPNAKFFLITLDDDKQHVARIRRKIADKELLALQAVYDETNADELFAFLKTLTLVEPPPKSLRGGKLVR